MKRRALTFASFLGMREERLTRGVIRCFHATYNELGFGLPELLYSTALEIVLRDAGISASREHLVEMIFRGQVIGVYRLDFLVHDTLILELKTGPVMPSGSRAQLLTYLRATRKRLGLLLFFGPVPEVQRIEI